MQSRECVGQGSPDAADLGFGEAAAVAEEIGERTLAGHRADRRDVGPVMVIVDRVERYDSGTGDEPELSTRMAGGARGTSRAGDGRPFIGREHERSVDGEW